MNYFGLAQNPPTTNTIASFTLRDLNVFVDRSADVLVKVNGTQCPLTSAGPQCEGGGPPVDPCLGLGGDTDADGDCDNVDNCPTVANADQADGNGGLEVPADGVGNACDNCLNANNPRVAAGFLTTNAWATLSGGQRDDDHDGYGNKCDADFTATGALVGGSDLAQYRPSNNKSRTLDVCGTVANQPCARYDLSEAGALTSGDDLAIFRGLNNKARGPRCATHCTGLTTGPLPCTAGTAGSCTFVFTP
jgi:hypothetical protein